MNDATRNEIELACNRLITAYCHYIDHGQANRVAELFTENGVWRSTENEMVGVDAIRQGFQARQDSSGRMSRHVCNNFLLHQISETQAAGCVYLTLYRHDGKPGRSYSELKGPIMVGEYQDKFELTPDGWRISERIASVDFIRRDPKT